MPAIVRPRKTSSETSRTRVGWARVAGTSAAAIAGVASLGSVAVTRCWPRRGGCRCRLPLMIAALEEDGFGGRRLTAVLFVQVATGESDGIAGLSRVDPGV